MINCADCIHCEILPNRYGDLVTECSVYNCVVDCDSAEDCMFFEPMQSNNEYSTKEVE